MTFDEAVYDFAIGGQGAECRLFILTHETTIAVDVSAQDSSELTFQYSPLDDGDTGAPFVLFQVGLTEVAAASVRKCT